MKTKEEVIKEAWGKLPIGVEHNKDGWLYFGYCCNGWDDIEDWLNEQKLTSDRDVYDLNFHDCDNGDWVSVQIRPKSLQGIENNNDWIKVDNIEEFPTHLMECFVFDDDGDISYFTFGLNPNQDKVLIDNGITHYQLIIKPKPPLY